MATAVISNPRDKASPAEPRWARCRVDVDYVSASGETFHLHYEQELEPPRANHPTYQIGIAEL